MSDQQIREILIEKKRKARKQEHIRDLIDGCAGWVLLAALCWITLSLGYAIGA